MKKGVLKNFAKFTGKHLCWSFFFNKTAGRRSVTLSKKETLAQVFSCQFREVFKSTIFTEHYRMTASCFLSIICQFHMKVCFLLVKGKISKRRLETDTKTGNAFAKIRKNQTRFWYLLKYFMFA